MANDARKTKKMMIIINVCVVLVMMNFLQVYGVDVNLTFINHALSKGAVCLDGSPGGYYHDPGYGEGVNNWVVFLTGGGWCNSETDCVNRSLHFTGSTNLISHTFGFSGMLSNKPEINPDFFNWNRIQVVYCDGGSFSADVEEVNPKTNLHFRGARIFRALVDDLLQKGMKNANNAILAGNSAGALSTMLKCDEFRASLPNFTRVKCLSGAGLFFHGKGLPGAKELREQYFADVVQFHGLAKGLPKSCTSKMDPHLCLFPENFIGDIQTPLFILQSAFDGWQLTYMVEDQPPNWINCTKLQLPCNRHQVDVLREFRKETLEAINMVGPSASRGLFVTSCFYHFYTISDERWNGRHMLKNKTVAHAVGEWFFDKCPFQEIENTDFPVDCGVM